MTEKTPASAPHYDSSQDSPTLYEQRQLRLRHVPDKLQRNRRQKPGIGARKVAAQALASITERRQTFFQAFDAACEQHGVEDSSDKGLAQALIFTTLRHYAQLELIISRYTEQPLPEKRRYAKEVLRMGIASLLLLEQPPHAVLSVCVEIVKYSKDRSLAGLVNAVLRKVSSEKPVLPAYDAAAQLPGWMWHGWVDNYGKEAAQAMSSALTGEPPLDLTFKAGEDVAQWAETLGGTLLPNGSVRLYSWERVEKLPGFEEGIWWVQDVASTMPVRLLEKATSKHFGPGGIKGKRALDVCAAPGGKTAQLANSGAEVTALDISGPRMRRLSQNVERLGLNVQAIVADALIYDPAELFDVVLLDAPCSSTGTIRRHPDLPFLKTPRDMRELAEIQRRFLAKAPEWLVPGGMLLYCVCSLQKTECEIQMAEFLRTHTNFKRVPFTADMVPEGCSHWVNADGELRLLPHYWNEDDTKWGGMDGFFAALLVKEE